MGRPSRRRSSFDVACKQWLLWLHQGRHSLQKPHRSASVQALSGVPLAWLLVLGLPKEHLTAQFPLYLSVIVIFGLFITWCGSGCNSPIFAEIVPMDKRSLVYAFDRCFEGAIAACAAPAVGIIAECVFGYDAAAGTGALSSDRSNADALGKSLLLCLGVPWALCFCIYFGLYRTYPADKARLKLLVPQRGCA
jgi:hypothetical protein